MESRITLTVERLACLIHILSSAALAVLCLLFLGWSTAQFYGPIQSEDHKAFFSVWFPVVIFLCLTSLLLSRLFIRSQMEPSNSETSRRVIGLRCFSVIIIVFLVIVGILLSRCVPEQLFRFFRGWDSSRSNFIFYVGFGSVAAVGLLLFLFLLAPFLADPAWPSLWALTRAGLYVSLAYVLLYLVLLCLSDIDFLPNLLPGVLLPVRPALVPPVEGKPPVLSDPSYFIVAVVAFAVILCLVALGTFHEEIVQFFCKIGSASSKTAENSRKIIPQSEDGKDSSPNPLGFLFILILLAVMFLVWAVLLPLIYFVKVFADYSASMNSWKDLMKRWKDLMKRWKDFCIECRDVWRESLKTVIREIHDPYGDLAAHNNFPGHTKIEMKPYLDAVAQAGNRFRSAIYTAALLSLLLFMDASSGLMLDWNGLRLQRIQDAMHWADGLEQGRGTAQDGLSFDAFLKSQHNTGKGDPLPNEVKALNSFIAEANPVAAYLDRFPSAKKTQPLPKKTQPPTQAKTSPALLPDDLDDLIGTCSEVISAKKDVVDYLHRAGYKPRRQDRATVSDWAAVQNLRTWAESEKERWRVHVRDVLPQAAEKATPYQQRCMIYTDHIGGGVQSASGLPSIETQGQLDQLDQAYHKAYEDILSKQLNNWAFSIPLVGSIIDVNSVSVIVGLAFVGTLFMLKVQLRQTICQVQAALVAARLKDTAEARYPTTGKHYWETRKYLERSRAMTGIYGGDLPRHHTFIVGTVGPLMALSAYFFHVVTDLQTTLTTSTLLAPSGAALINSVEILFLLIVAYLVRDDFLLLVALHDFEMIEPARRTGFWRW